MDNREPDEGSRQTKVAMLRRRLADARAQGFRVRSEWLGGETGGGCEIAGVRWLFLDLSLSIDEQISQVDMALSEADAWARRDR